MSYHPVELYTGVIYIPPKYPSQVLDRTGGYNNPDRLSSRADRIVKVGHLRLVPRYYGVPQAPSQGLPRALGALDTPQQGQELPVGDAGYISRAWLTFPASFLQPLYDLGSKEPRG